MPKGDLQISVGRDLATALKVADSAVVKYGGEKCWLTRFEIERAARSRFVNITGTTNNGQGVKIRVSLHNRNGSVWLKDDKNFDTTYHWSASASEVGEMIFVD